ncbi:MAG: hypothetical protein K2M06_01205 [Muribaculaceae bacterium]|nr:hypothetical protein [Muribaculaceae bacterium]
MDELKEITFIARHYRKGRFDLEGALKRVRPQSGFRFRFAKIAAASAIVIAISAAAAIMIRTEFFSHRPAQTEQTAPAPSAAEAAVKVLDFEATPLPIVVEEIQKTYGVEVTGIPEDADRYTLSLHYEGTASDLVETINEILDIDMKISQ